MNYAVFRKTMDNVRKHKDIKLVTTERRKNYLVWKPNFYTTIFFWKFINNKNDKNTDAYE